MLYLAEFYLPDSGSSLAELASRARAGAERAAATSAPDSDVRFVRAIHVPSDESCFVLYTATSAAAVNAAGACADITFDRVVEAAATS